MLQGPPPPWCPAPDASVGGRTAPPTGHPRRRPPRLWGPRGTAEGVRPSPVRPPRLRRRLERQQLGAPTSRGTDSPSASRPAMCTAIAAAARSRHSSMDCLEPCSREGRVLRPWSHRPPQARPRWCRCASTSSSHRVDRSSSTSGLSGPGSSGTRLAGSSHWRGGAGWARPPRPRCFS